MANAIGAKTLEKALGSYYTEEEVRAMIPGSRQNQSQRLRVLRDQIGINVRGIWVYRRRETDAYFANPPKSGRPRGKTNTPAVPPAAPPPVKKKTVAKKKTAAKKKRATRRGRHEPRL